MQTDKHKLNFGWKLLASAGNPMIDYFSSIRFSALAVAFVLQLIAFWAAWRWLFNRVWTSGEERWGLAALAAAIFVAFIWRDPSDDKTQPDINPSSWLFNISFAFSVLFTLLYAAGFSFTFPLPRAILAMTALTFTLSRWRFGQVFHVGLWSLLVLSLPLVASLQFYLGYPLRVVVGQATTYLLRLQGLDIWREGVCLHFGERLIWIDAPCSGVKMLWFGLFLTAVLICLYRLSFWKSTFALASAFGVILLGNVFRASALFYIESEIIKAPDWIHEAIGVFSFVSIALGIAFIIHFLRKDFRWLK
jgi:exosortase/archaeosortase family protein